MSHRSSDAGMDEDDVDVEDETYNPWTVVNLVFHHLADEGLHPVLGAVGNPGDAAAELLRAMGIRPVAEGNAQVVEQNRERLAELRRAVLGEG
jgi:hypothetical protein